jgi:hypothetical protein
VLHQYQIHPELGWMHARIQTWFPLQHWVTFNGVSMALRAAKGGEDAERRSPGINNLDCVFDRANSTVFTKMP